jgi:hypothetical protein
MSTRPLPRDERIERFLNTLLRGIKEHTMFFRRIDDGLLYPSTAIRYWQEIASRTDDGRDVVGSKSAWVAIAYTSGRQYAGMLTAALH